MAVSKSWTNFLNGQLIDEDLVTGNDAWAEGNVVPHSEGTLADNQFKLGTSTARWAALLVNSINTSNLVASGSIESFATQVGIALTLNKIHTGNADGSSLYLNDVHSAITGANTWNGIRINQTLNINGSVVSWNGIVVNDISKTSTANIRNAVGIRVDNLANAASIVAIQTGDNLVKFGSFAFIDPSNSLFGINTINPTATLDVAGTLHVLSSLAIGGVTPSQTVDIYGGKSDTRLYITNDTTNSVTVQFGADGGDGILGTRSNHNLILRTNNGSIGKLDTSGRLGIGTVNPSNTLDVGGNFGVDSTTFFVDAATDRVGVGTQSPSVTVDVHGELLVRNGTGVTLGKRLLTVMDSIGAAVTFDVGTETAYLDFGGATSTIVSTLSAFQIRGSGVYSVYHFDEQGFFGVGHDSPSGTLDVHGSIYVDDVLRFAKLSQGYVMQFDTLAHTTAAAGGSVTARIPVRCSGVTMWIELKAD
jgi:hypothetical protein